ncbi:SusC/RagA family TonB-linked outer membrane protein [Galbibacter pacificus]|uniref:TonB-dependent receptor n=1 Tax=Galbibacter pacificus TaxID=2996052 RepID=A0ABT6FMD0_9FLAO|nr:TonB-dependent receptor [Galbibacter pacificus]MDG3580869.1 TonB-dependent receptor [Galbibacter pacificus]MDG3584347.1 TonB-dependent receptor [Galbibacter pacificus]
MKTKLRVIFTLILVCMTYLSYAQEKTINGTITDQDGLPLPGVNIQINGTHTGTQTDFDGKYSINATVGSVLIYTYIGQKTEERTVGNSSTIDITMQEDAQALDEVVIVGYGTSTKREVTDNIASVSSEDINLIPTPSVQSTLSGKAAGVQVTQVNGKAESGIKIRVRGVATISSSQEPLYVIDGVPMINSDENINDSPINPLVSLNPNDIESIEILKDASSAAIYGARGTNGVVLITTKRGKAGKTKVSINSSYGWSKPTNKRDFLNTREYVDLFTEATINSGGTEDDAAYYFNLFAENEADWRNNEVDTDWQDLALVDGSVEDFGVNVSGGSEKTQFFLSTGYNKTDAIIRGNKLERYSLRSNIDHTISNKFKVGISTGISKTKIDRLSNDNSFSTPLQAIAQLPFSKPYEDNGVVPNGSTLYYNFLFQEYNADHQVNIWRVLANLYGEYQITQSLKFRSEFGYDFNNQVEERFFGSLTESASTNGYADANAVENEKYVLNNYFSFDKTFSNIDFNAVAGMSYEDDRRRLQSVEGQEFPSDDLQTVDSAAEITGGGSSRTAYNFLSYFGRAGATIAGKYILKASLRYDGSSRFGKDERYGLFPAVSAGWIISEENFLKNNETLSLLKIRGSWGITGNAGIGNFASRSLFGGASYNERAALSPTQLGDPSLKWENTSQYDLGIDFGFFNNRISLEADYYNKNTSDLLLDQPVPSSSGFTSITQNVGELKNEGFEFVLNTKNFIKEDFFWSTSFNISTNKNEITELPGGDIISGRNIAREGETVASFYMVEFAGADPDNGDALFVRNTLNPDGTIDRSTTNEFNEASRVVSGSPFPDLIAGLSNTIRFKDFDMSFTFQGQWGASIYNDGGRFQSASADYFDNQTSDQLDRWQQPGDITDVPQARLFGANGTQQSTRYLQEADFIRLRNVTLGYTIPSEVTKKFQVERLRLYFTAFNLLTFTDYTGWDPESTADFNSNNDLAVGVDFYSAPPAQTLTLGINIDF